MPPATQDAISLRPGDAQAGGLIDDVDVTIIGAECVTWDYGKGDINVPAVCVTMKTDDGEQHAQYFSAGDLKYMEPKKDGSGFTPARGSTRKGLSDTSNAYLFFKSLVDSGFPENRLGDDVTAIVGLYAHVQRTAQPPRRGLARQEGAREPTVLLVTKIHRLPWEKGAKPLPGKVGAPTPAAAGTDLDTEAIEVMLEVLSNGKYDDGLPKSKISGACFPLLKTNKNRTPILKLLLSDDFLGAEDRPWAYDGTTVTA